jgi:hypothetical protein
MDSNLWYEFLHPELHVCGLCGNHGQVNVTVTTPAGAVCRTQKPCICPNGRSIKLQLDGLDAGTPVEMDLDGRIKNKEAVQLINHVCLHLASRIEHLRGRLRARSIKVQPTVKRRFKQALAAYKALDAISDSDNEDENHEEKPHGNEED